MAMNEMLAYSPVLPLVESYVAIYKIYVLRNPLTQEIFYVGQTMQEIETRLLGHLADSESNKEKVEYIKNILSEGQKPIIEPIETIAATCYIDKMAVNEREIYWIRYYKSIGCKLLNKSATAPNTRCAEYHTYLSAIKQGKSSYHYYYCGKTVGGVRVYDEKRLKADGFNFPQAPSAERVTFTIPHYYNPYESCKYKLKYKIGYREDREISLTEVFPPQPQWSIEFLSGIPFDSIFDDIEDDLCDDECDELEQDNDFEPDSDDEPEIEELSYQPSRDYTDDEVKSDFIKEIENLIIGNH